MAAMSYSGASSCSVTENPIRCKGEATRLSKVERGSVVRSENPQKCGGLDSGFSEFLLGYRERGDPSTRADRASRLVDDDRADDHREVHGAIKSHVPEHTGVDAPGALLQVV